MPWIVVILVIIILLVGVILFVLPKFIQERVEESLPQKLNQAYDSGRTFRVQDVGRALQVYYQQNKSAPSSLEELVNLKLIKSIPSDPETGEAVQYRILEGKPQVCEVFLILSTGEKIQSFCAP